MKLLINQYTHNQVCVYLNRGIVKNVHTLIA